MPAPWPEQDRRDLLSSRSEHPRDSDDLASMDVEVQCPDGGPSDTARAKQYLSEVRVAMSTLRRGHFTCDEPHRARRGRTPRA